MINADLNVMFGAKILGKCNFEVCLCFIDAYEVQR